MRPRHPVPRAHGPRSEAAGRQLTAGTPSISQDQETWPLLLLFSGSVVSDSTTPQTAARQAPRSMGFPRQEYWGALPFPSPGGGKLHLLHCRQILYQ